MIAFVVMVIFISALEADASFLVIFSAGDRVDWYLLMSTSFCTDTDRKQVTIRRLPTDLSAQRRYGGLGSRVKFSVGVCGFPPWKPGFLERWSS